MKLNDFNSIFQTEKDCLKYIANLKEMKCNRCASSCLNISDLRIMRCLKCNQTFIILIMAPFFVSHKLNWHLGFVSSLDEEILKTWHTLL